MTVHLENHLNPVNAVPLRIAIDAHAVGTKLGGNESYAVHLVESLAQIDSFNQYTIYITTNEARDRFHRRWPNFKVRATLPHTPVIRIPLTLSAELRKNPVDVLHVQFTAPPFCPCPTVVSIHDLSFEHLPETFKRRSRMQLRLTVRKSARRAARILSLSEHSRRDIIETYGISPDRVTAIPLAAASHFAPITDSRELQRVRHNYGIDGEYILSVGSIQPRKNLARLVKAYAFLRAEYSEDKLPKLVLAGKCAWLYDETLRALEETGLRDAVVLTGYVPEADLPALYSGALCFIYPSYFEGFGLPPLEAMKCGAPVIVGNRTSLPEVVGDAALTVDPFDVEAIAAAIKRLMSDSQLRQELRSKGQQRAGMFDWRETARKTLKVYQEVCRGGRPWPPD
ncbi:MAG TPA: glycosyltransferase family 1 protein [Pyrinomonadaceae bacterium]|nr:glycosyltransferase family 1 protein [Pyrinomonadaceae bacterium]